MSQNSTTRNQGIPNFIPQHPNSDDMTGLPLCFVLQKQICCQVNHHLTQSENQFESHGGSEKIGTFLGLIKMETFRMGQKETGEPITIVPLVGDQIEAEKIKVRLEGRVITVEVNNGDEETTKSTPSHFLLPRNVDVTKVTSRVTPQGQLRVEAPYLGHWKDEKSERKRGSPPLSSPRGTWAMNFPIVQKREDPNFSLQKNVETIEKQIECGSKDYQEFFKNTIPYKNESKCV